MSDFWAGALLGTICGGLPLWFIIIKVMEYFDNKNCLKYEDMIGILPDPNSNDWEYIGRKFLPDKRGGMFEYYNTYKLNNIKCYVGIGAYINDSYIKGSFGYAQQVRDGQTHLKMLESALKE